MTSLIFKEKMKSKNINDYFLNTRATKQSSNRMSRLMKQ